MAGDCLVLDIGRLSPGELPSLPIFERFLREADSLSTTVLLASICAVLLWQVKSAWTRSIRDFNDRQGAMPWRAVSCLGLGSQHNFCSDLLEALLKKLSHCTKGLLMPSVDHGNDLMRFGVNFVGEFMD